MIDKHVQQNYTMKILFGPMFGCELHLPADDYFLIVNPGHELQDKTVTSASAQDHAAYYTQNTLYIPCDIPSPNILLRLSQRSTDEDEEGIRVEVQDINGSYSTTIDENQVFRHEHICFAYKRSEDNWVDEIKHFNHPQPDVAEPEPTQDELINIFNSKKKRTIIIGTFLFFALLILAIFIWYKNAEEERHVLSLSEMLSGAPAPLDIVKSRDQQSIYVLAHKLQEKEWAQEALLKFKDSDKVKTVWLGRHKQAVISRLNKMGYPALQIDYTDPQHPVIVIYRQLTINQEASLKAAALKDIPFALDISTTVKTKEQLLKEARQGLDRLHIYYRQIDTTMGYSLIVRDALSDTSLSALQKFINAFNHEWGNSAVTFSINLNENWLENKSYLDSDNGYLFLNPRHWYFPIKHGDLN